MNRTLTAVTTTSAAALLMLFAAGAAPDADDQHAHDHSPPQTRDAQQPGDERRAGWPGDLYTLEKCPVSGMALGSMGDPVVKTIAGREVRFCCAACVEPFEEDTRSNFKKIDEQMIEDQLPHYPLDTCIVAGGRLGSMGEPVDHVYRNRLVRFCCAGCIPGFEKEPAKCLEKLDKAVIEKQKPEYELGDTCVVCGERLTDHGDAIDRVFANRLVRFCCTRCVRDFMKSPARYLKALAEGKPARTAHEHSDGHDHSDHDHGHGGHDHGGHGGHGHGGHGQGGGGCGGGGAGGGHNDHDRGTPARPRRGGCG